jgi:AraC-like DNA-binding protein
MADVAAHAISPDTHPGRILSDYREFPPPLALKDHVLCLWTQSIAGVPGEHAHRVLPDACIDVVFVNHDAPIVVGPWTDPFTARFPPGTTVVGARFHPGRAPGFLRLPASALLNQSLALRDIWTNSAHARFARVAHESTLPTRLAALEVALHVCLEDAGPHDAEVSVAIHWLAGHPNGRVEQLSRWLGFSHRHLQRRFSAAVGYGPKMFQSVLRFQRLLHLAATSCKPPSLVHLAVEAGYADQAHMTREVGRYSGSPPSRLLQSGQSTLRMSELFKTGACRQAYP